jgi:hypothetical protein
MKIILHCGAHRCANTSFQDYLRLNAPALAGRGIAVWGPQRTRAGLFDGLQPGGLAAVSPRLQRRAAGRVQLHMNRLRGQETGLLLVSDAAMLGPLRDNLCSQTLYAAAGERMARFALAFGQEADVVISVRNPAGYWASAFARGVEQGHPVPSDEAFEHLSRSARGWRDVISDVACAMPDARVRVVPHETFCARPDRVLQALTGTEPPESHARQHLMPASPLEALRAAAPAAARALPQGRGRWQPFTPAQAARMQERYTDDLMWLAGGADGLAQLVADPDKTAAGPNPPANRTTRGRPNDQEGRVADAG